MPPPVLTSLSQNQFTPLTVFTFTVNGAGFTNDAVVSSYDETLTTTTPLATSFMSATELSVTTLNTDLAGPNICDMTVTQLSGTSKPVSMSGTGTAPPVIDTITPDLIPTSGTPSFVLAGTGFIAGACFVYDPIGAYEVACNAPTSVTAIEIDSSFQAGSFGSGGGTYYIQDPEATGYSNFLAFTTIDAPTISGIIPPNVVQGSTDLTIEIDGTNYTSAAIAYFNGDALVTTYVSDIQLFAVIPAAMLVNQSVSEITITDVGGTSSEAEFDVLRALYSQSYATLTSLPAPYGNAVCLPEGKRMVVLAIDFTQLKIYPESIVFQELTLPLGNDIGYTAEPCGGYQVANINLATLQNSIGLSEIRSIIYNWRPQYGVNGLVTCDFAVPMDHVCPLYITNIQTMQTIVVCLNSNSPESNLGAILQGVKSFLGINNTTIRMLLPVTDSTVLGGFGIGKGTFIFTNFELPTDNYSVSFTTGD